MIITSITKGKKNEKRYNIYIDYEYCFSVDYEDVIEFCLKEGSIIDEEGRQELLFKCQYKKALNSAVRFLAARQRSEKEIREKLLRLEYDGQIIKAVIKKLRELDYVNDEEFARQWIEERKILKPVGSKRLAAELVSKGIDMQVVDDMLAQCQYDDLQSAEELLKKKFGRIEINPRDAKAIQRMYRYLLYRGMGYDVSQRAIYNYFDMIDGDK